jgi:hypothetical protein
MLAAALALVACGVAIADDTSSSRFGGDGYAYFNQPTRSNTATAAAWRQNHPNGMSQRDLQAVSSTSLAASASRFDNANVVAAAPSDPSWRQTHPNGLTNRELQAAGASSLAAWQLPVGAEPASRPSNVAQSKTTSSTRK